MNIAPVHPLSCVALCVCRCPADIHWMCFWPERMHPSAAVGTRLKPASSFSAPWPLPWPSQQALKKSLLSLVRTHCQSPTCVLTACRLINHSSTLNLYHSFHGSTYIVQCVRFVPAVSRWFSITASWFPEGIVRLFPGATAVCIVCYIIPVALHLKIYYSSGGYTQPQPQAVETNGLHAPLLQVSMAPSMRCLQYLLWHSPSLQRSMTWVHISSQRGRKQPVQGCIPHG